MRWHHKGIKKNDIQSKSYNIIYSENNPKIRTSLRNWSHNYKAAWSNNQLPSGFQHPKIALIQTKHLIKLLARNLTTLAPYCINQTADKTSKLCHGNFERFSPWCLMRFHPIFTSARYRAFHPFSYLPKVGTIYIFWICIEIKINKKDVKRQKVPTIFGKKKVRNCDF